MFEDLFSWTLLSLSIGAGIVAFLRSDEFKGVRNGKDDFKVR